jgi:hypothetical protein
MSRNGSGTYSLYAGVNPVVTGTTITSAWANNTLNDIATAMTASIANDGQTPILANLPMSTFRHTGVGNAVARTDYAAAGQVQDSTFLWGGTAGGTADALTITLVPAVTAWASGQRFLFVSGASPNATTTPTLNPNAVGAKTFVRKDGTACAAGDIPALTLCEAVYDGTNVRLVSWGAALLTALGTVTSGTWNAGVIAGQYGGTGVANTGKTITLGGNLTTSGANAVTLTTTGPTNVTLPTSGSLVAGGSITASGLTQSTAKLLGRTTASSGAIEEITVSGATLSGGTLTIAGSALTLLATLTPTAAASVDALTTFSSTYDNYLIELDGILPAANDVFWIRVANAGTVDSGSNYSQAIVHNSAGTLTNSAAVFAGTTTTAGKGLSGYVLIHNANDATNLKAISVFSVSQTAATPGWTGTIASYAYFAANAISGVRFLWAAASNFSATGKIRIYGMQNS